jgi:hypothetical protein
MFLFVLVLLLVLPGPASFLLSLLLSALGPRVAMLLLLLLALRILSLLQIHTLI